jgi:hypothetical protein
MIPELGPVVAASPKTSYHISWAGAMGFLNWLEKKDRCLGCGQRGWNTAKNSNGTGLTVIREKTAF